MKQYLQMQTLYKHISSVAQKYPHRIALLRCDIEGKIEEKISYKELQEKIEYVASWLLDQDIRPSDSLALAMTNSPEFLIISWAAWSIGIITVPLDLKRGTIAEHLYKVKVSRAKLVVAQKEVFAPKEKVKFGNVGVVEILNTNFKNKRKDINWNQDIPSTALILFTSGTTAHPKGALLSVGNLIVNALSIKKWFKISNDDRFMVVLPLHHINSTSFCLATLLGGGSIAVVPTYSNSRFWQQLALTESTFTSIVPSICFDQLSRKKEFDNVKDKLKINKIQIGSAPVVVSDVKKFMEMYVIPLYQGYGQTETALRVAGVPLDLDKKTYNILVDSNSIGKPMDWAKLEILDNNGNILGEEKEGELAVKGDAVMKGYIDKTDAFKNGYFLTGDIGYYKKINNDRYFFIKGRKKEIIIKGGVNISPVAVEDKLKRMCNDIDQVFVIGVPDRRFGEEIAAVICWKDENIEKAKAKSDLAKAFLKYKLTEGSKEISRYESPKYIVSIGSKDLPTTSTGKVQRSVLKNKIPFEIMEHVNLVAKANNHSFILLTKGSAGIKQAYDLYNYSWYPLTLSFEKFKDLISNTSTIAALDFERKIKGMITFMRVDFSEADLSALTYNELVSLREKNLTKSIGDSLVCISICGPNYKQEPVVDVKLTATIQEVDEYLKLGKDSVFNFHTKPKGGFAKGAKLIKIMPDARPEDKRSLGYNMLLLYPKIVQEIRMTEGASVATQLIEAVMVIARQLGIKNVYAFSRPSGLAKYISEKN